MKNFYGWLNEAIQQGNVERAAALIQSYLSRKVGTKFVRLLGVEQFRNSKSKGFGIRYFYGNGKSIRFNWKNTGFDSSDLASVDVWEGNQHDPNWNVSFADEVSLATALPFISDLLSSNIKVQELTVVPPIVLGEAVEDAFDAVIERLKPNEPVPVGEVTNVVGSRGERILNYLRKNKPESFEKQGRRLIFVGTPQDIKDLIAEKDKIVEEAGGTRVKVQKGGSNEQVDTPLPPGVPDDKDVARVAYEDQLEDLRSLVKLTVNGASNALFVAGRGGVGKTYQVEKALESAGLRDGDGYFKQTGSASPAGIYRLLFQHRADIVLFDDADGALSEQDGRNLIKAATDTKKSRKLAWAKSSKNLVDPDEITDEQIDAGFMPSNFIFTGRIIFISNLTIKKLDPDGALRTRALMISIDPTDEEVLGYMKKIVDNIEIEGGQNILDKSEKEQIVDMMGANNRGQLNIRKLVRSLNIRASAKAGGVQNWERLVKFYA